MSRILDYLKGLFARSKQADDWTERFKDVAYVRALAELEADDPTGDPESIAAVARVKELDSPRTLVGGAFTQLLAPGLQQAAMQSQLHGMLGMQNQAELQHLGNYAGQQQGLTNWAAQQQAALQQGPPMNPAEYKAFMQAIGGQH